MEDGLGGGGELRDEDGRRIGRRRRIERCGWKTDWEEEDALRDENGRRIGRRRRSQGRRTERELSVEYLNRNK